MTTPTPTPTPTTNTSSQPAANNFDITTASGYSALLPCATYAINSAFVSDSYFSCPKADFDAGRFDQYIGCLCQDARDNVLRGIGYGISAGQSYKSLACNEYQVFSANQVYNGYCSKRGFVLTTIGTGAYPVTTVTSLGGPISTSSVPPSSGSPSRISGNTITIIGSVIGGIIGLAILVWLLKYLRAFLRSWRHHHDERKRVAAANRAARDQKWVAQHPYDQPPHPGYAVPRPVNPTPHPPAYSPVSPRPSERSRPSASESEDGLGQRERAGSGIPVDGWVARTEAARSARGDGERGSTVADQEEVMSQPSHAGEYRLADLRGRRS